MELSQYTVYKHTTPSGKVYIGITSMKPKQRWANGRGYKSNIYFTNAIEKYGWENIQHDILCDGLNKYQASLIEKFFIAQYQSNDRQFGYNITEGGEFGFKQTEETRKKIADKARGRKVSDELRKHKSEIQKGKPNPWSEDAKKRYREFRKKIKVSEETCKKISEANSGEKNGMFGKYGADNPSSKPVLMLDYKTNVALASYASISEASQMTGKPIYGISKCCLGKQKFMNRIGEKITWKFESEV